MSGEYNRELCALPCAQFKGYPQETAGDYRAGADYEVKLLKLQWHLERAHSYGRAIAELDDLLKTHAFFQQQGKIDILSLRTRLIRRCDQIGDALIDIYQQIEQYLNRVMRDHERARKLIHLRGLIERHEHLPATNIEEVAATADGPWFRESRWRTLLAPSVIDERPELFARVMARAGLADATSRDRRVEIQEHRPISREKRWIVTRLISRPVEE